MTKVWYATFGGAHIHPLTGESLRDCYTLVPRDEYVEAHDAMTLSVFGRQWAFLYEHADEQEARGQRSAGVKRYGLREVPWIEPSTVARALMDEVWPRVAYRMKHLPVFIDDVLRPAEVAHQLALLELRRATAAAVLAPDSDLGRTVDASNLGQTGEVSDPPQGTDAQALADRAATGCQYDVGLCLCPGAPYRYSGCRAQVAV